LIRFLSELGKNDYVSEFKAPKIFIILTHRIHLHTHPIHKMQSIAQQFSSATTLRVNSSSSSVSKKSFNKNFQVRAAVSMPSMDSQDEDDGVVIASSTDETFTPRAPALKQGNAVFS